MLFLAVVPSMSFSDENPKGTAAEPARIFIAGNVAYREFIAAIQKNNIGDTKVSLFLREIKNYEISVSEDENVFVVVFSPKNMDGHTLRGGGGEYHLRKTDLRIVKSTLFK